MTCRTQFNAALLLSVAVLGGCVAESGDRPGVETASQQPRQAVYRCGEDRQLAVNRAPGGVRVIDPSGEEVFLPAAPPNQTSRFGAEGYALVIEGREALWMKSRAAPLDCTRG